MGVPVSLIESLIRLYYQKEKLLSELLNVEEQLEKTYGILDMFWRPNVQEEK